MADQSDLPRYDELPEIDKLRARHAWDVFGPGDELGRLNLLTEETRRAACAGVQSGALFNVCLPLDLPDPPWGERKQMRHTVYELGRHSQDDYLDNFYLQKSTQWDGFRHVRAREFGFWGGVTEGAGADGDRLGIERWADHGLVGRGVLVDAVRHFAGEGRPLAANRETAITVEDLDAILAAENVTLRSGDFLLVRTGWSDEYLAADTETRQSFATSTVFPGLHAGVEMARYLWDHGVVGVAADNPAVEVAPGSPEVGSLHRRLLPLLGFALGEMFAYGELAEDCASDGRYDCLLVAVPLNLPGGVGSPGNAVAIK
jgi:kynurenine formamidase